MRVGACVAVVILQLLAITGLAWGICGRDTRKTVDSLKCEDLARNTWYQINVNKMCGTLSGVNQTLLELQEKRPVSFSEPENNF